MVKNHSEQSKTEKSLSFDRANMIPSKSCLKMRYTRVSWGEKGTLTAGKKALCYGALHGPIRTFSATYHVLLSFMPLL